MPTILCFGDSLTWGSNPDPRGKPRHGPEDRWPDVLAAGLGSGFRVIADGMRGRTTGYDEHLAEADRNGARLLPSVLYTHAPVDLVILMLGANDLKPHIAGSAVAALQGMRRLAEIVTRHAHRVPGAGAARLMIVSPPKLVPTTDPFYAEVFAGSVEQSARLAPYFEALAAEFGAAFFDAGSVAVASPLDGVHLDAANTRAIGLALTPLVRGLFANG